MLDQIYRLSKHLGFGWVLFVCFSKSQNLCICPKGVSFLIVEYLTVLLLFSQLASCESFPWKCGKALKELFSVRTCPSDTTTNFAISITQQLITLLRGGDSSFPWMQSPSV